MRFNYSHWVGELRQQEELTPLERRFEKSPKRFQRASEYQGQILSSLAAILIGISSIIPSPSIAA